MMTQINAISLFLIAAFSSNSISAGIDMSHPPERFLEEPKEWCYFRPVEIIVDEVGWNYHMAKHILEESDIKGISLVFDFLRYPYIPQQNTVLISCSFYIDLDYLSTLTREARDSVYLEQIKGFIDKRKRTQEPTVPVD